MGRGEGSAVELNRTDKTGPFEKGGLSPGLWKGRSWPSGRLGGG